MPSPGSAAARLQDFTIDRSAVFSPDGKLLATSGSNSPICVWAVGTGVLVRTYPNRGSVFDLRWKVDGKLAVLTFFGHENFLMQEFGGAAELTPEQEKRLRDEADGRERKVRNGEGQQDRLDRCFLSADGRSVVAIWMSGPKNDRRAGVYRFAAAQTAHTAKPEREVAIPPGFGTWVSDDGKVLLTHVTPAANEPHRIRALDLAAGKDKPAWELTFAGGDLDWQPNACFSSDGKRVVVLFWGGNVELWDGPSRKRVRELGKLPWYHHNNSSERGGIDLAPDGKRVALIDRDANGLVGGRVVDVTTGRDVCRLARRPLPRSGGVARFSRRRQVGRPRQLWRGRGVERGDWRGCLPAARTPRRRELPRNASQVRPGRDRRGRPDRPRLGPGHRQGGVAGVAASEGGGEIRRPRWCHRLRGR